MSLKSKFTKLSITSLLLMNLVACGSNDLIITPQFQQNINTIQTFSTTFDYSSLTGQPLGKWKNYNLSFGKVAGNDSGYKTEAESIQYLKTLQKGFLRDNDDYAIVLGTNGKYFLYEINAGGTFGKDANDLSSYGAIRDSQFISDLKVETGMAKVIGIASEDTHIRFLNGEKSPVDFNFQVKSPYEALDRLKKMEQVLLAKKDHRGLFASMYRVITQRAILELEKYKRDGNTKAANFEEKLMINFANKYFEAYDAYSNNQMNRLTEVWKIAFDSGRKSQNLGLNKSGNIAEILALSMCAHIIHDLSFTLKEINYDKKDPVIEETFTRFNTVLFEEKDNILKAVYAGYGKNIVQDANDFFGSVGNWTMQKVFSIFRSVASSNAYKDKDRVVKIAISFSDSVRTLIPGGNSVKTASRR